MTWAELNYTFLKGNILGKYSGNILQTCILPVTSLFARSPERKSPQIHLYIVETIA